MAPMWLCRVDLFYEVKFGSDPTPVMKKWRAWVVLPKTTTYWHDVQMFTTYMIAPHLPDGAARLVRHAFSDNPKNFRAVSATHLDSCVACQQHLPHVVSMRFSQQ